MSELKRRGRPKKAATDISPNGAQGEPATAVIPDEAHEAEPGRLSLGTPASETKGTPVEPEIGVTCEPVEVPKDAPPEPAKDPAAGDKTPAVVEWRRKYWPADVFAKVYPPSRKLPN